MFANESVLDTLVAEGGHSVRPVHASSREPSTRMRFTPPRTCRPGLASLPLIQTASHGPLKRRVGFYVSIGCGYPDGNPLPSRPAISCGFCLRRLRRPDADNDGVLTAFGPLPGRPSPGQSFDHEGCSVIPSDLDRDGDVDQSDFGILQSCLASTAPACARCRCQTVTQESTVTDVRLFSGVACPDLTSPQIRSVLRISIVQSAMR